VLVEVAEDDVELDCKLLDGVPDADDELCVDTFKLLDTDAEVDDKLD